MMLLSACTTPQRQSWREISVRFRRKEFCTRQTRDLGTSISLLTFAWPSRQVKEVLYYEIEDGLPTGKARTLKISAHKLDDAADGSKSSRLTPEQLDEVAVHI
eukprot:4084818-Pleurochrysis_carterae.AAC.1